jgi:hypothetical protein
MLSTITLSLLLAAAQPGPAAEQVPLPRHLDADAAAQRAARDDEPTDPWFDRDHVATDDPAFILAAVESARQGVIDSREAANRLDKPELRSAAQKITEQNEATTRQLEKLAGNKGWRLPESNPGRETTVRAAGTTRANANFILHQIAYHENTVAQYRAQIAGKGDKDLKKTLRDALPGYQKNLDLLLKLKP